MTADVPLHSLNSGEISRYALARVDLAKLRVAAETQLNLLPHVLGPAQFRPGLAYTGVNTPADAEGWLGEFYYSETEKALLLMTAAGLHFVVDDALLTRGTVTAAITNGGFDTDLTGWTISDESGAASTVSGGLVLLGGTGTNYAQIDQEITVNEPDTEHALRLVVTRNNIVLKVGTTQGNGDYLAAELGPGTYSLAFTPTGDFWIRLAANNAYASLVDSIAIEGAGTVALPVPYSTTAHFNALRYDQSGDVLFVACAGFQQRRIERRTSDSRSWGVALYQTDDGPFRLPNTGSTTMTPSATSGTATLTASRATFDAGHVGALFRLTHSGQTASATMAALNDTTGGIRVSGLASHNGSASQRAFTIVLGAGLTGTVTLQRSLAEPGSWTDVESYTVPTSKTFDDTLDNQIIYYRLKLTAYTSGTADAVLTYNASSQTGIARITAVTLPDLATVDILREFGGTTATADWSEGEWSDYRGWPAAVALHDGRLAWFPAIKAQLSVSDAFASFDDEIEGDSGPVNRTIATGGLDGIRWALSLQRLIVATAAQEISIRASTLDGPLTPTDFVARVCSTRGAAAVRPIKVGTLGIFVERNQQRVFALAYDFQSQDYTSKELTRLNPEICAAGVRDVAVQMQPDTRMWFVLADGRCAVLTYDTDDDVVAWIPVETDGAIERVAVLPGNDEDEVYFIVRRTIDGGTKRYLEKLAKRSEARGGTLSRTVDSHIVYSGAPTTAIAAPHLAGKTVRVWADGAPLADSITLDGSGNGTLPAAASNYVAGLGYVGRFKPAKLAYAAEHGTALTAKKRVSRVGLVAADIAWKGVRIGRDFTTMTGLSATYRGRALGAGEVLSAYDAMLPFNGGWDEDSRVCIEIASPYCATFMGLALHMETNEPVEPPRPPRDG